MMTMEVELQATFPDNQLARQATLALREQGVIDVRRSNRNTLCALVERSRYRQAEDTILRHQGRFLAVAFNDISPE